ncbi:MAG: endo-1,4-beta-xylanase [bacterium]
MTRSRILFAGLLLFAAQAAQAFTISGRVTCTSCVPTSGPPYGFVAAVHATNFTIADSCVFGSDGGYAVTITNAGPYGIIALPVSGRQIDGFNVHEFVPSFLSTMVTNDRTIDFTTDPAYQVILIGTNESVFIGENSLVNLFVTDPQERTRSIPSLALETTNYATKPPSFNFPTGQAFNIHFQWALPHAGRVMVELNDGGGGYQSATQGVRIVNISRDVARSVMWLLQRDIDAATVPATNALVELAAATNEFVAGNYDEAAGLAVVARENLAVENARAGIELYRKGDLAVQVRDMDGNPVPGARVDVIQQSRDFQFGNFDPIGVVGTSAWARLYADGIRFNTAGFYWPQTEPLDDVYNWNHLDDFVGIPALRNMGFTVKGHPLIWLIRELSMPPYLQAMDYTNLAAECQEHITAMVSRYTNDVRQWEVINEAHGYAAAGGFTRGQVTALTRDAADLVHALDPGALVIVNNGFDFYGSYMNNEAWLPDHTPYSLPTFDYIADLLSNNVALDVIGLQLYDGGCSTVLYDYGLGGIMSGPTYDLATLAGMIRRFEDFQKPIYLTEQSVPSDMEPVCTNQGYWHVPWSEASQADFVEGYHTIGFGSRRVRTMTWWDMVDTNGFIKYGTLFRADGSAKPSYERLTNLLARWWTATGSVAGADGWGTQRPFAGDHVVKAGIGTWSNQIFTHVFEQTSQVVTISLTNFHTPKLTATAGPRGRITPPGETWLVYGSNQAVVITPDPYYSVSNVYLDGTSIVSSLTDLGNGSYGYTIPAVATNHAVAVLFQTTDSDTDTLPDGWEMSQFGALTNANQSSDVDGDGFPDTHEYIAGTGPNDPTSYLRVDEVSVSPAVVLRWPAVTGKWYRVEAATNVASAFSAVASNVTATPPENTHTDAAAGSFRSYRLMIEP